MLSFYYDAFTEGEVPESGIHIIIRVDFTATYSVSLQYDAIEEYQCLVNKTNDMSSEIFTHMKDEYLVLPELIKREVGEQRNE